MIPFKELWVNNFKVWNMGGGGEWGFLKNINREDDNIGGI